MNTKNALISCTALAVAFAFSGGAAAAPAVVAEADAKNGVSFEYVADPANPISVLDIRLPLNESAKGATVPERCFTPPAGFAALCNIDGLTFKAVIYGGSADASMPSVRLGRIQLPAGALSIAKSGEIAGFTANAFDGMAKGVPSEVLSASEAGPVSGSSAVQER